MSDLVIAIAVMIAVSATAFRVGFHWGRSESLPFRFAVQILALLLMAIYLGLLWNRPVLSRIVPASSLIILSNWLPFWGSFFVGLLMSSPGTPQIRRCALGLLTAVLVVYSTVAPILGQPPECAVTSGRDDFQHQTTPFTCSAACAASLLRLHGVHATESELAELCLTREGTHWMGVYRGLKLKTQHTDWNVVVEPFSPDLKKQPLEAPGVLSFTFDESRFEGLSDHGFMHGTGHSVLMLGSSAVGYVSVFDPAPEYGPEEWDSRIFDCVTDAVVLRLVPANPDSQAALNVRRRILIAQNANSLVLR